MKARSCIIASVIVCAVTVGCDGNPLGALPDITRPAVADADLYQLAQPNTLWKFFKGSPIPVRRLSQAHTESHALVRYNGLAATQLDGDGKVRANASFPDSSIIVKELSNGSAISTYAIMMKVRGSASAGRGDWVWAEFGPDGEVKYPTKGRGAACTSCHAPGIDYTRMNDSQP